MRRKKRAINHDIRRLFCLLFMMMMAGGWLSPALSEVSVPSINASGNPNLLPAVNPIGPGAKYTAVLYNNRNGLPTSEVKAIAQTDDGFIWIGAYSGLIRYDGNTFERIQADVPISNVMALLKDSRNRLWMGTNDAGFLVMENGRFRRWGKSDGLESLSVRHFAEDADGYIYVGTTSGLLILDPGMKLSAESGDRLSGTIQKIRRGGDGLVYVLTRAGELAVYSRGLQVSKLNAEDCAVENINCMLPDSENPGWFWLGDNGSRLYYGEVSNGFENARVFELGELLEPECLEEIGGKIWVCCRNGIATLDGDRISPLADLPMNDSVSHVMTDFQGNLWFTSTKQGVMKVVPNQFQNLFTKWNIPEQVINSTCLYDSILFLATDKGLLALRDGEALDRIPITEAVTAAGEALDVEDLLTWLDNTRIRSLIRDSRGNLWISPWNGLGLIRYAEGKITVFTPEDGMVSEKCRTVYECEDGSILVVTRGGLSVIRDDRVVAGYGPDEGVTVLELLTATEGFNGEYIVGSDGGGLFLIGPDGITNIGTEDGLSSDVVMRVRRSRERDLIWIVTGNSLAYMTPDHRVTTIRKFPYANNYDLYENNRGEMWVLSSDGIYVAPVEQLIANGAIETVHYGFYNGLPCVATSNSYSELTEDGDLYIACTSSVIKVNIEEPFETDVIVKMAVPFVDANDLRIWPDSDGGFSIPSDTHKLTVSGFVINYASLNPKVSYFLEGFDTTSVTVNRNELKPVDYTNLRGGEYHFIMRLEGEHTNGSNQLSILIRKELAIYEQLWFWIIVGMVVLLLDIWLIHLILKRQARRIELKKDQERIAGDLRLASNIQVSALPHTLLPIAEGKKFDLCASMTPAKEVGGDFYDYFLVDDDHLAMVIADVSGKGIPAALFMMVSKALIKTQLMTGLTPAEALTNVNQQLCENNESQMFVTVWAAVLELSSGKLTVANAGHEYPVLKRMDGCYELFRDKHGFVIGGMETVRYKEYEIWLEPGTKLFVYTDGVPEATSADKELFGTERMLAVLNKRPDAAPQDVLKNMRQAVDGFVKDAEQFDDLTMMCMEYIGPRAKE